MTPDERIALSPNYVRTVRHTCCPYYSVPDAVPFDDELVSIRISVGSWTRRHSASPNYPTMCVADIDRPNRLIFIQVTGEEIEPILHALKELRQWGFVTGGE